MVDRGVMRKGNDSAAAPASSLALCCEMQMLLQKIALWTGKQPGLHGYGTGLWADSGVPIAKANAAAAVCELARASSTWVSACATAFSSVATSV